MGPWQSLSSFEPAASGSWDEEQRHALHPSTAYLNDPAATDGTVPEDINDSGQVVGHYTGADNNFHGFLYNVGSSSYVTLTDPLGTSTYANGINNSGLIVGFYGDFSASGGSSATHAFTYDSSSLLRHYAAIRQFRRSFGGRRNIGERDQQLRADRWKLSLQHLRHARLSG